MMNFYSTRVEQLPFLDHYRYLRRHHILPARVATADLGQNVSRKNGKAILVEAAHRFDQAVLHEIGVEMGQVWCHSQVACADDRSGLRLTKRINVQLQIILE